MSCLDDPSITRNTARRPFHRLRTCLPVPVQSWLPDLPPPTARNLWLCLALLVAVQNCAVLQSAQGSGDAVLGLLVWGGALICLEDQLERLRPRPGWFGLVFGTLLLVWVLARTAVILSLDGVIFALTPLAGLALTLLCLPLNRLGRFREALLCLLLLPASKIIGLWVVSEQALSLLTARGAALWLDVLGLEVAVEGRRLMLPGGSVSVAGACNGTETIALLVCVAIIFVLAFPVRSSSGRAVLILLAPLIGLLSNTGRIALLAVLSTLGQTTVGQLTVGQASNHAWFHFFHDEQGSLVFSALAVGLYGWIYLRVLERDLSRPEAGPPPSAER